MSAALALDSGLLRQWIGRSETATDLLTPTLAERFHATIGLAGPPPGTGELAPRLIHFCLNQPAVPMAEIGEDGHPARGGFLPPVALPRRMWAASEIAFTGDLRVGDTVTRRSTIADVVVKEGRSGILCFVTVEHEVSNHDGLVATDRQSIVYRAMDAAPAAPAAPEPAPEGATTAVIEPSVVRLFRYSALTFNGHRIHYDMPYAREAEGYPGLVVHGPLQATLLLHRAAALRVGEPPARFSFRSTSTLFGEDAMCLHAGEMTGDMLSLWTARPGGPVAMQAEARWQ